MGDSATRDESPVAGSLKRLPSSPYRITTSVARRSKIALAKMLLNQTLAMGVTPHCFSYRRSDSSGTNRQLLTNPAAGKFSKSLAA